MNKDYQEEENGACVGKKVKEDPKIDQREFKNH